MSAAHGLAMWKALHDSLSMDVIALIDVEDWSANEERIHPTRLEANVNSFTETGLICRTRALLECERKFFKTRWRRLLHRVTRNLK